MRTSHAKRCIHAGDMAGGGLAMTDTFLAKLRKRTTAREGPCRSMAVKLFLVLTIGLFLAVPVVAAAPGDVILDRKTKAMGFDPVVFPHWRHRINFRCSVCHEQIFEMKRGANAITMEKMNKGEFCGKCHNGKVAFNVEFQNCARCHVPAAKKRP